MRPTSPESITQKWPLLSPPVSATDMRGDFLMSKQSNATEMDRCPFQLFIVRAVQPLREGSATNFLRCWWIQNWQGALTNVAPWRLLKRAQDKQIWRPALFCSHRHRPLPGCRNLVLSQRCVPCWTVPRERNFSCAKEIRYVKRRARPRQVPDIKTHKKAE